MILKVMCDKCETHVADVDPSTLGYPFTAEMFKSPARGEISPFDPGVGWDFMFCKTCRNLAFKVDGIFRVMSDREILGGWEPYRVGVGFFNRADYDEIMRQYELHFFKGAEAKFVLPPVVGVNDTTDNKPGAFVKREVVLGGGDSGPIVVKSKSYVKQNGRKRVK